jgi:bifunctional enzyme CysN/CysC
MQGQVTKHTRQTPPKSLLRFLTCGSVDDGKSTLIGRLLHDSKLIFEDQLSALAKDSTQYGSIGDDLDFALLLDGLEAEREQGITIDVAYRFFSTQALFYRRRLPRPRAIHAQYGDGRLDRRARGSAGRRA